MASKSRIPVSLLIIDDTPEDRENYKDLLNQQEDYLFSIIEAEDAESGLDIYDCVEIDCILLDFSLPGIDGLRFLEEYKRPKHNHENSQFAPVVMISGRGSESIAVTALKNGAVDYLIKNEVNSDNIFRAVKNAVDRKNLQKQLLVQEQRRARGDKELKESEGRFRLLVNAVKDYALIMLTEDGRISSWNSGARRMLGYHDGEILGQHYRKLFRVEDIKEQIPERELAQAAEFGHIVSERYHLSRDAKQLWTHTTLTSVKDETGALKGFVEIFKDNSDLKAAQDGQTNSNGLLQLVLELSPIAILVLEGKNGKILFANRALKNLAGVQYRENASTINECFTGSLARCLNMQLFSDLANKNTQDFAEIGCNLLGSKAHLALHVGRLPATDSNSEKYAVFIADHTNIKNAAAILKNALENRNQFLADACRELQDPISSLKLQADSLLSNLSKKSDSSISEVARTITLSMTREIQKLDDTVSDLRDVTELRDVGFSPNKASEKGSKDAVSGPFEILGEQHADENCEVNVPGGDHTVTLWDRKRLDKIMQNLLNNIAKHSDGKPMNISVLNRGSETIVALKDGNGPAAEQSEIIFGRFVRSKGSNREAGLDLGLYIAKRIVEAQEAQVSDDTSGGCNGAEFSLHFPNHSRSEKT